MTTATVKPSSLKRLQLAVEKAARRKEATGKKLDTARRIDQEARDAHRAAVEALRAAKGTAPAPAAKKLANGVPKK